MYPVVFSTLLIQNQRNPECVNYLTEGALGGKQTNGVNSVDFNPALQFSGHYGYPGFKIRFSRNAFWYASTLIARLLDEKVQNVYIPPFSQCLPEVSGCAQLTNIMITHYQCPQNVLLYPVSYNQLEINVQNFALSLSGKLGGQIVVLLPIPLCGLLCVDARQISISLRVIIERNPFNGATQLRMSKCSLTIGYLNIYVVDGGLLGGIINNNFRGKLISQAQQMLPTKFCNMVPSILNEQINSQLATIPQTISIMQIFSNAALFSSKPKRLPEYIGLAMPNNQQWQQCANCDYDKNEFLSFYSTNIFDRIRNCASDLTLSTYLLGTVMANYDFILSLSGEFSPSARGGTPFPPPILQFPMISGGRMLDLLISDYTFNTLLYHLHRTGIFTFRLSPETGGGIGDFLNLTCNEDDFDFDLSVELQDAKDSTNETNSKSDANSQKKRIKRLSTLHTLIEFGVCFGDLAPEIREKNPGKKVYIIMKTNRAPSVQFQAANGGTALIEFIIDGFIFLDGTNTRVGHIRIAAEFAAAVQAVGNRIIGKAKIQRLELIDMDKTFGLPQEAFNNLADLASGMITKAVNKKLAYGIPITVPQLGLPIKLYNIHLQIIEHAIFISTDATVHLNAFHSPYRRFPQCSYYKYRNFK
uniref:Lipid-binding serum glycoprotein C-terminal domain-containing protein n=1 Tax=Setaria digitata TaxID=48799 RepID=A0A915PI86_9BILA